MVFDPAFGPMQLGRFIHRTLGHRTWQLSGWVAVMAFVYSLWLIPPILIGKIINTIESNDSAEALTNLWAFSGLLAGLLVFEAFLRMKAKPALAALSFEASYRAKTIAFQRLLEHSIAWHDQELTGSKIERVTGGGSSVAGLLDYLHSSLLGTAITFFSVIAAMSAFDWQYSLYGFIYVALFWGIQVYFNRREKALFLASKIASERAAGAYAESAGNIVTIKSLNLEQGVKKNVSDFELTVRDNLVQQKRIAFRKYGYFRIFDALAQSGFIVLVGSDVLSGQVSLGLFTTLIAFFRSLDGAVREAVSFMDGFLQSWISVGRIAPLVLESSSIEEGTQVFPKDWKSISLQQVTASYAGGKGGIAKLTLEIKRGEHIGIVGSSGAGKSTIAKVLTGIVPLSEGSYTIGDIPFADISPCSRAQHLSIVLQDSEMFSISLRENITALRDIAPERIQQAAAIAELSPMIDKLKDGFNSVIGEKGYRLSGGERQRVGIARAICQNPDILILDEAMASLDSITEEKIHDNLIRHLGEKTLIIIAHRLSTIRAVDRVVVIENGTVVESGPPDLLLQTHDSKFRLLWEAQHREKLIQASHS